MAGASADTRLTVLNDHYNHTVADVKKLNGVRDRNFVYIAVMVVLLFFLLIAPDRSQTVFSQLLTEKLGVSSGLGINVLSVTLWYGIAYSVIRYFQTVINLEKAYTYLGVLEDELARGYSTGVFTREGTNYLANYPMFSDWVNFMYRGIFPLILLVSLLYKVSSEWHVSGMHYLTITLDICAYLTIVISTALYMWSMHQLTKKHR